MNDSLALSGTQLPATDDTTTRTHEPRAALLEFVGASEATIAEAVRQALARASRSLRTLDGLGVLVIPQICREGATPRFRVTLQISATNADAFSRLQQTSPPR